MPPKQSGDSAAYKQLKQDIAAGTIGRLYVFHGEEAYLRDYYLGWRSSTSTRCRAGTATPNGWPRRSTPCP